jgi:hypothetical protein
VPRTRIAHAAGAITAAAATSISRVYRAADPTGSGRHLWHPAWRLARHLAWHLAWHLTRHLARPPGNLARLAARPRHTHCTSRRAVPRLQPMHASNSMQAQ